MIMRRRYFIIKDLQILKNIQPWINESCTVRGHYLCQGKSVDSYKESLKYNDVSSKNKKRGDKL